MRKVIDFLGLRKSIVAALTMVVLVGLGEKMAERFLPLYLIALGGGAFAIGLLNGLDNLLSALYSLPGGYASDKLGYKRALILFNLLAMAGYLVVIFLPYWQAAVLGAMLFMSWSAISLPATMGMVSAVLPKDKRTMGVSVQSLVRRIPMALGPVIGGVLIGYYGETQGIRLAFMVAFGLAAISLTLQQVMIAEKKDAPKQDGQQENGQGSYGLHLLSRPLRQLLVSDILVRFCEQIPYAFVVIWCVSLNGITPLQFGYLTTIEMVTAMLVYIPVAYLADKSTKKPFVLMTFIFFTTFPLVLLFAHTFWVMALAFVVRGLKEFGEPTRKALIMDLAPDGRKAATFGLYYLIRDVVVAVAAFSGALLWDASTTQLIVDTLGVGGGLMPFVNTFASPTTNFLVAVAFGAVGTLYFGLFGQDLGRRQPIPN